MLWNFWEKMSLLFRIFLTVLTKKKKNLQIIKLKTVGAKEFQLFFCKDQRQFIVITVLNSPMKLQHHVKPKNM